MDRTFLYVQPGAEILTALVISNPPALLAAGALRFVGRISYGVYLWHIPLAWTLGFPKTLPQLAALFAFSLIAGWLSHVAVERWFLQSRTPEPIPAVA
ncbi:MAG TPA: hypothetical protein VJP88_01880 [Caulobacteraceae bacterium]|nr:hypothetical protein [Caulobacteraceae bacterium]